MTAEREAMTLAELRDDVAACRGSDPDYANEITGETLERWLRVLDNHLSRAAEPVAWSLQWPENVKRGSVNVFTVYGTKARAQEYANGCADPKPVPAPLYTHPPEPARDADAWRKYCDDASAEAIKKYAAKGDVEGAVLFMRITCGPTGKITQKEIDAAMAQESGE